MAVTLETRPDLAWEYVSARVVRTAMVGGGTSYDVYIPVCGKSYKPIAAGCYATVIVWRGKEYYRLADYLRTPDLDALPPLTDKRLCAFRRIEKLAERLEAKIAARAFSELTGRKALPFLWSRENHPSKDKTVRFRLRRSRI
jgi:hypothetical protein